MTDLQQALVDFIAAHVAAQGMPPSLDEIGRGFPGRPNGGLQRSLESLAAQGLVQHMRGRWGLTSPEAQLHFPLSEPKTAGLPPR